MKAVEKRTGLKIACIEEIAFRMGFIDEIGLRKAAQLLGKSSYGQYLYKIIEKK